MLELKQRGILNTMPLSFLKNIKLGSLSSLFGGDNSVIGLDIGASSIKAVQFKKEKERAVLVTYGELSLAHYSEVGNIGRAARILETKLTEAVADLLREAKISGKHANVSISLKDSFFTSITMPFLSDKELKEAVPYEARKYVPVPMSEVILEWRQLPPFSPDVQTSPQTAPQKKNTNIILTATPKEVLDKYKNILSKAGIEASNFEIEVFAFARAAIKQDFETVLMMDLGASSTKMIISDAGVIRMSHSFDRGGQDLTLAVSQSLGIDFDRAEITKREVGILKKPETEGTVSAIEPIAENIVSEGERFLLDWRRKGGRAISKVYLGGGGALMPGIRDLMIKTFGVEVDLINPFSKVVYPPLLEPSLRAIGPTFVNSIGLALRDF